ncbi:hypothetical protein FB474_1337 [Oryzihumus leptocrescens]|uniref:Uncharacterized protein n=2 Tax=Oryzihumus leptocrescens TaxID=297536 RepID=A0A542ZI03_9MICO|nr:hypothetical protein FB474_1337 [Oryzihumus leptocrescens]
MPRRPSVPYTPARDREAPGAWLLGLGVFALLVASASLDGPGWFDPAEQCALDSTGGISSAGASGAYTSETRFFPPRVTCSLEGSVHAYQSEGRSWLIGAVLLAALACLVAGVVLLWLRARRQVPTTPTAGRPLTHIGVSAVLGVVVCLGWSAVGLMALFLAETVWGAVAAMSLCLATTLPVLIHLDGSLGPPRPRLTTSWWRALLVLGATAVGGSAAALAAHAGDGGHALGAASVAMAVGGATGAALASGATWLAAHAHGSGHQEAIR